MNDEVTFLLFTPSAAPKLNSMPRQVFQKTYQLSNREFRLFLIESDYVDPDNQKNRLLISVQQISFLADIILGVLILKVGRLPFEQAQKLGNALIKRQCGTNVLDYLFEQVNLFISEDLVSQFDNILMQARRERQMVKMLQNVARVIRSLESIISILQNMAENQKILNFDIIENYLENHQNLRHEAREVENLVKIQQINRHLHLSSSRNEIIKYTLIFNFVSTAVSFCSVIFSIYGMNYNSFMMGSVAGFYCVVVFSFVLSALLFFCFMRKSREARNVYM
ncbi:Transmembrane domain-containing protein [Spironucleus salmonicida]|uniref:Transmembrane domain-containing protein n=1 Tax=Spironucleus salmonicida TaxID=348837 RepID=V6LIL0_9EUKA|nr:Transmembrane domain-containing protein [Spironucleus salmonicida]|eukprot:EST43551.1 Transmembrane domain-containing protein [Spironucleus salmonicida]